MIKIEKVETFGWEAAIRGMRNPKNSWDRIDSEWKDNEYELGQNDHKLASALAKGGPVHAKYRRMITVYADITAPLFWWKEFDTYKVGTVANSCSTMHKIHAKEFTVDDFSFDITKYDSYTRRCIDDTLNVLNKARVLFLELGDKAYWRYMIELLPSSYNQKRTVMLNYEVLHNIYFSPRYNHKLKEWRDFCEWIKTLPYSELIVSDTSEDN
jgi:hypothetical protein